MQHTDSVIHNTALDRDLPVRVYGEAGHPVIAFPAAGGTAGDWEDHGMVGAVHALLALLRWPGHGRGDDPLDAARARHPLRPARPRCLV